MTKKAPMVEEITDFEVLEIALRELAIEKGLFTPEDHRQYTEFAEAMGPTPASRLVAKAWTDPAFKKRALEDPIAASLEVGINWLNSYVNIPILSLCKLFILILPTCFLL